MSAPPPAGALARLRGNALAAHAGPLLAFLLLNSVPDWFRVENPALPWHLRQPEHWWYPVQTLVCGALLLWWREHYQFPRLRPAHALAALLLAAAGILVWVAPG
jgi:hypothetical protein